MTFWKTLTRSLVWHADEKIVATFPHRQAIVKNIVLPSTDPKELREMVKLQAYRRIPLAPEDMVVAYHPVEMLPDGTTRLFMIVVRASEVQERLKQLAGSGVFPDRLVLDSPGIVFTETADLLPEDVKARKRRQRSKMDARTTAAALVLLIALGAGGFALRLYHQTAHLAQLTQEENDLAFKTRDLRRMERQTELVHAQRLRKGTFLHTLAELNTVMPARISIQTLLFEKDQRLEIQGTTFSLSDTLRLVQNLQKSPLFASVELLSSNNRRLRDQDVVDFAVSCRL